MSSKRSFGLSLLLSSFIIFVIILYCQPDDPQPVFPPPTTMSAHANDILSNLHVTLKQASTSPPAVTITVTNYSPKPVTLLTWDSPLDGMALQLGLLSLTPEGGSALDIPTIFVNRKMPPAEDAIVSLAAGESRTNTVELREVMVPADKIKGKKTNVKVKGRWRQVWPMARGDVTKEMIENLDGSGDAVSGEFETEGVDLEF